MTVNFGVIGLGNRGSKFTLHSLMTQDEINVVAVCDNLGNNFGLFSDKEIKTETDYKEILHDNNIDAVYIASPDKTHAEIVLEAIKCNKHIICEKPLAINPEDLKRIKYSLQNYKKVFQMGYVLRYSPLYYRAKSIVAEGTIGNVIMANVVDHINYGGYAFFHDWHRQKKNVKTLLLQKATHSLDILNWIVNSNPEKVIGMGGLSVFGKSGGLERFNDADMNDLHCKTCKYKYECEESLLNIKKNKGIEWLENWPDNCVFNSIIDVDDHQSMMIKYENAAEATYMLCQFAGYYKREFQFFGSKGELYFDDATNKISVHRRDSADVLEYRVPFLQGHDGGDDELIDDFLSCLKEGKTPRSDAVSGIKVADLALAAQNSIVMQNITSL